MNVRGNNDKQFLPGESGPRRSTPEPSLQQQQSEDEPVDTAAANAAAALFADQLGVSSSSRRGASVRLLGGNGNGDTINSNNVDFSPSSSESNPKNKKKGGGIRQFLSRRSSSNMVDDNNSSNNDSSSSNKNSNATTTTAAATTGGSSALPPTPYVAMKLDGTTTPLSSALRPNILNTNSARSNRSIQFNIQGPRPTSPYAPPGMTSSMLGLDGGDGTKIRPQDTKSFDDTISLRSADGQPRMFDAYGHRAPYREGPYDYHHDETGRLIKKRWCK